MLFCLPFVMAGSSSFFVYFSDMGLECHFCILSSQDPVFDLQIGRHYLSMDMKQGPLVAIRLAISMSQRCELLPLATRFESGHFAA